MKLVKATPLLLLFAGSAAATGSLRSYAPGVNPPPHQRADAKKIVWTYTGAVTQGEAESIYNAAGAPTVEDLLNTAVNQISFIANVNVNQSTNWWKPGVNDTGGCGQDQTYQLPFGYDGTNATTEKASLPEFQANLKKLHDSGMTITLTLGSWCTQLPVKPEQAWTDEQFSSFVTYFQQIRGEVFGNNLDGIDFDWEGFCSAGCLKGTCICGWDDQVCGNASPEELADGVFGEADKSSKQVMRNEYVKYRKQTSFGQEVDLLDLADGILLQWYSGFDAALCQHSSDPKACTCDNQ